MTFIFVPLLYCCLQMAGIEQLALRNVEFFGAWELPRN